MANPTSAKDFKKSAKTRGTQATTAAQWKKKKTEVLELPSGQYAKIRRPGMEKFLSAGFLPNALSGEITKQLNKAQGRPDKKMDVAEIMKAFDGQDFNELVDTMDRITAYCFMEPEVLWHKRIVMAQEGEDGEPSPVFTADGKRELTEVIPDEDRDEEALYTDEIEQDDKNFVFQYAVGGSSDLKRFREETQSFVAPLESGGDVEHAPERTAGTD